MFNNPLDSFHNTVAEAKEEREQLDRLLTISTPRERLLVAAIALLLAVLAAWLFLGEVSRSLTADGLLVAPGGDRSVQALIWIESDAAHPVEAGMPATIELDTAGTLDGSIVAVAAVPLSEDLAPVSVHRVEILLDESFDPASLTGRECRIVIEVGRQPPIDLLSVS